MRSGRLSPRASTPRLPRSGRAPDRDPEERSLRGRSLSRRGLLSNQGRSFSRPPERCGRFGRPLSNQGRSFSRPPERCGRLPCPRSGRDVVEPPRRSPLSRPRSPPARPPPARSPPARPPVVRPPVLLEPALSDQLLVPCGRSPAARSGREDAPDRADPPVRGGPESDDPRRSEDGLRSSLPAGRRSAPAGLPRLSPRSAGGRPHDPLLSPRSDEPASLPRLEEPASLPRLEEPPSSRRPWNPPASRRRPYWSDLPDGLFPVGLAGGLRSFAGGRSEPSRPDRLPPGARGYPPPRGPERRSSRPGSRPARLRRFSSRGGSGSAWLSVTDLSFRTLAATQSRWPSALRRQPRSAARVARAPCSCREPSVSR